MEPKSSPNISLKPKPKHFLYVGIGLCILVAIGGTIALIVLAIVGNETCTSTDSGSCSAGQWCDDGTCKSCPTCPNSESCNFTTGKCPTDSGCSTDDPESCSDDEWCDNGTCKACPSCPSITNSPVSCDFSTGECPTTQEQCTDMGGVPSGNFCCGTGCTQCGGSGCSSAGKDCCVDSINTCCADVDEPPCKVCS